jgi:hypothetical protein
MSDFFARLSTLCKDLCSHRDDVIGNEQATKEHLIGPFFAELGWKKDPKTWRAEYDADFNGKRKGEKVDYAILQNNEPVMLIECKPYSPREKALAARDGQLARYFSATSARVSVITNGIVYRFFTDLEKENIQDVEPFFIFDCSSPTKADIDALERFSSAKFDIKSIRDWAADHQFSARLRKFLATLVSRPTEAPGLAQYLLEHTYNGQRSQKIVQRVNEQIAELMNQVLGEVIREKFAMASQAVAADQLEPRIITSEEEKAAYAIVQGMIAGAGRSVDHMTFVDKRNWMNISYKRKGNWFLRLCFNEDPKFLILRAPIEDLQKLLPNGVQASSKGKNVQIEADPRSFAHLAKVIVLCFDARVAAEARGIEDDDGDESLGSAA